jgi:hypothetical protein
VTGTFYRAELGLQLFLLLRLLLFRLRLRGLHRCFLTLHL